MNANAAHGATAPYIPLEALRHIDDVCARFEAAWKEGQRPSLGDFLGEITEPIRTQLFRELLRSDQEQRGERGATLDLGGLRARFPEYTGLIDALPVDLGDLGTVSSRPTEPGPVSASKKPTAPGPFLGYEIVKELGRGGMGVVYLARHLRLQRLVALKVILAGEFATPAQHARFEAEARAVARLKHSGFVQIYAGGKHKGRPFLALEYVEGGSLESRLAGKPQPPQAAARLMEKVARAVHAAHQKGIVHRDLKPANILLDEPDSATRPLGECTPKISDFGLAKNIQADDSDPDVKTRSRAVVGTPNYMAPEQARGQAVSPKTDVYSLGVILYEMLTGKPPFEGTSVLDTLDQVCHQEPEPPRRLQRQCPRDIEIICLKCLEKDPDRRYASAQGLAEDLAAFLAHRPLKARPVGMGGKVWRWGRRNPVVAGLLTTVLLVLLTGTGIASFFAVRANHWAVAAEDRAEDARRQRDKADELAASEGQARLRAEWLAYANQVCLAQREFERKMAPKANMILDQCRPDFRNWEHAYLRSSLPERSETLKVPARATAIALHPNGDRIALIGDDLTIKLLNISDSAPVSGFAGPQGPFLAVAFSADGNRLATVDREGNVGTWDGASGRQIHLVRIAKGPFVCASFGPGARTVAVAHQGGGVEIWDAANGQHRSSLSGMNESPTVLALSPEGSLLGVSGSQGFSVWDLVSGHRLSTCKDHSAAVSCLAFSPDGKRLFSGSADHTVKVWEASRGLCLLTLEGHAAPMSALAMSHDGRRLVSTDRLGIVRTWIAGSERPSVGSP